MAACHGSQHTREDYAAALAQLGSAERRLTDLCDAAQSGGREWEIDRLLQNIKAQRDWTSRHLAQSLARASE